MTTDLRWVASPPDDDDEELQLDDYEREDERLWIRNTSNCDGLCIPSCGWCLAAHVCPDQCGGGEACPYVALTRGSP